VSLLKAARAAALLDGGLRDPDDVKQLAPGPAPRVSVAPELELEA